MKTGSVAAFALMVVGLLLVFYRARLFAHSPVGIAVQVAAALLMLAARITFGRRSFHAAANPTAGGIVTSGPYAYIRHPIYAAVIYFIWTAAIDSPSHAALEGAALVTIGAVIRMFSEERLLVARYPEYRDYMRRVKRVVPYLF